MRGVCECKSVCEQYYYSPTSISSKILHSDPDLTNYNDWFGMKMNMPILTFIPL